jgi:Zn-dependent peptidase ImmA (M78 family)
MGPEDGSQMTGFASFGSPERFEIAVRWIEDREPRERRPTHGGWSTGELRLTVAHHVVTQNHFGGSHSDSIKWYLLPVFEWLATNWASLLHEERFGWHENSAAPAATAVFLALRRLIDEEESFGPDNYSEVQAWWSRHALRAADASALFPDVVFRRLRDEIEISWTGRQPSHAPDGFRFALIPGAATLSVAEVAAPLWEVLNWVAPSIKATLNPADKQSVRRLEEKISKLKNLATERLESPYLPTNLFAKLVERRTKNHLNDNSVRLKKIPALSRLDDAVLMFGGVSPNIGLKDIDVLMGILAAHSQGQESTALSRLVDDDVGAPLSAPFEEGYDLAEQLLEMCSLPSGAEFVDVRSLLHDLGVKVSERTLMTSTIRGVAIAGKGYSPIIVVNKTSDYNSTEPGKRFTLAHELFHLLYDRSRAKRITHISGPWASPGVEKRANAFAAMFLMPRELLRRVVHTAKIDQTTILTAASAMQVGVSALVEHLYNTSMIDDFQRDEFRSFIGTLQ